MASVTVAVTWRCLEQGVITTEASATAGAGIRDAVLQLDDLVFGADAFLLITFGLVALRTAASAVQIRLARLWVVRPSTSST